MPGYHPEFEPDFQFEEDQPKPRPADEAVPKPRSDITTISIGEKGIAQVGESEDCEDGGILRI